MKFKTLSGKYKEISIKPFLVDWDAEQGSQFSAEVLDFLYPYWKNDVVVAELPVAGKRWRFDFVNLSKRIIIETDGKQHDEYVPYMHGNKLNYLAQIKRDLGKDKFAEINGFKMVRIKPKDLPLSVKFFREKYDIFL